MPDRSVAGAQPSDLPSFDEVETLVRRWLDASAGADGRRQLAAPERTAQGSARLGVYARLCRPRDPPRRHPGGSPQPRTTEPPGAAVPALVPAGGHRRGWRVRRHPALADHPDRSGSVPQDGGAPRGRRDPQASRPHTRQVAQPRRTAQREPARRGSARRTRGSPSTRAVRPNCSPAPTSTTSR